MVIELVERLDAAASELLACLKGGEASSAELLGVLSGTKAVRGKLDTVQALAAAGVAGSRNHGDGGAHVLAESTGVSRNDARNQVRTIKAIGAMPAVRDAVEEGRVSVANAGKLADALDKTSAGEIEADKELLAKAESLPAEQFAKEAKRWTAQRQADDGEAEYRRLRARRAVRMWNGDDGMVHLYGQFDPVTGRRIRNRLNRDVHRLYDADKKHARAGGDGKGRARARRGAGSSRVRAGGETRSLQQCMADAFENMTRTTSGSGKPYADIALVARLGPDTEKLMASTVDGDPLPAAVIERLAGESSWFGLVLSAKGVPMWKGRNTRKATESQFQALMALYGGCAGCGEPDEQKVHAHHMDPFRIRRRHRLGQPHTAVLGLSRQDPRPSLASGRRRRRQAHHQTPPTASTTAQRAYPTPLPCSSRPSMALMLGPMLMSCSVHPSRPPIPRQGPRPSPASGRTRALGPVVTQSPVAGAGPVLQGRGPPEMRFAKPERPSTTHNLSLLEGPRAALARRPQAKRHRRRPLSEPRRGR